MLLSSIPHASRYLAGVEFQLLGPVSVVDDGRPVSLGGLRERALLTMLALAPGRVVSTDLLIEGLWGADLPANPANALQALVSRLRRSLGADVIATRAPGYVLDADPEAVDVTRFRTMVAEAAAEGDPSERGRRYRTALALWRGPALSEFQLEEFAVREVAALEELRLAAIEGRISADLEAGSGADLVPELEELVAAHPLRESLRAAQMLALYRAGRQADALRAYSSAQRTLGEELGIDPGPELQELEQKILMQDQSLLPSSTLELPQSTLPARLASFIGRSREIAEVIAAFQTSRLVTLTGPGGAGKTSLAIEVGRALEVEYPDGVWLIELGPVTEPARVIDTVVSGLKLEQVLVLGGVMLPDDDAETSVVEHLKHRRALLILDNCEHLVDAAAHVAELILLQCPKTEILATSRDRLGIPGELLWRVPPLAEATDAVDLFVTRATAISPGFVADEADRALIVEICRRVDGMPLAIELAAARVRSLPVAEIARRLESGIGVLADRQQTLQGTIDWSHELLASPERELFAALSVFQGTFSLAAAEAVAGGDALDTLERLIDSSLLTPVPVAGTIRYRMLETLRSYAGDRLVEAGLVDETMTRLLDFFLDEMSGAEDGLRGPGQLDWLQRVEADHDSLRGVLDWGVTHAPADALRLAGMLGWFWFLRGSSAEARERLSALLDAAGDAAEPRALGDALLFHGLCHVQPEHDREAFQNALAAYLEAGYEPGAVNARAMVAAWGFDLDETLRLLDESYEAAAAVDYGWGMALVRFLQAGAALGARDNVAALDLATEAIDRFNDTGDRWGLGYGWYQRGTALRALGEYAAAEEALRASLENARPMRLRREMAPVLCELGSIATMLGDYDRAERLLDDAEKYADELPFAGSQGMVRNAKGRLARLRGDVDQALELHETAIAYYEEGDAHGGLAWSHSCAGYAAEMKGNLEVALDHHLRALAHARTTGDVFAIAQGLEGIGVTLTAAGEPARGVTLIHAGLALRERSGGPLPSGERFDVDRALAIASEALDDGAYAQAVARGTAIDMAGALDLANG
jgi:predicted ATPase/DNA-binding SARP family transcriptional activator